MTEAVKRIDYGVKRGKRIQPVDLERKARDEAGRFMTAYTPELKQKAITDALAALECGARVEEIADRHQIPRSTMYSWLVGDERASKLRTQFFDGQVTRNLTEIRSAGSPLDLARAREELTGWIKVAERRDSQNYGQKQELTVEINHHVLVEHGLANSALELFESMRGLTIDNNEMKALAPGKDETGGG